MAATQNGQSKTDFVREILQANPAANPKLVNEAWRQAGHDGSISGTLVHKVRVGLGLTGKSYARARDHEGETGGGPPEARVGTRGRGRPPKAQAKSLVGLQGAPAIPASGKKLGAKDRGRVLEEVEGAIDRLIFALMSVGGMEEVENALRRVRRLVVRSHQA